MSIRLTIGLVLFLGMGCAHTVQYQLTEIDRWPGVKIDGVLRVQTFSDQTAALTNRTIQEGAFTYRTNHRSGYKKGEIANDISQMMVKHLRNSGLFGDVVDASSNRKADYDLDGAIAQFYAQGRVNKGAEEAVMTASILGGLAGSLLSMGATSGQKTEIRAGVNLQDITLRQASSTNVLWQGSVNVTTNFTASWTQADEPAVFNQADNCLKTAVTELIQRLAASLLTNSLGTVQYPQVVPPTPKKASGTQNWSTR